jgi:hypothetical protein
MTLSRAARTFVATLLTLILSVTAKAQAPGPNQTEWENETLNLRLFYPSDLVKADAAQVMHDGNLTLFSTSDPNLTETTHCLRPILLLELPQSGPSQTTKTQPTPDGGTQVTITQAITGTILLAELDIDCLTPEQQSKSTTLLADMAETVTKVHGMKTIVQPAWYNIGWQKVHMAAAQGQPQAQPQAQPQPDPATQQPSTPAPVYTMGISTNWNSHLLVWYLSSNSIDTLNRITKTTVRFGRAQAASLYPNPVGNASN